MAEILVSRPGTLAAVNQVGIPGQVKFNIIGTGPVPQPLFSTAAIITNISGSLQTNTKFTHALDNSVYSYSFGDRMGRVSVSGIAFENDCLQARGGVQNPLTGGGLVTGLDQILLFYRLNRVSLFNRPVVVFVGTVSILKGFLIGITFGTQSVETKTTAWTLQVAALPQLLGVGGF